MLVRTQEQHEPMGDRRLPWVTVVCDGMHKHTVVCSCSCEHTILRVYASRGLRLQLFVCMCKCVHLISAFAGARGPSLCQS